MRETKWQTDLTKHFEKLGWDVLNVHGHRMQKSSWPDLYIVPWGSAPSVWLELKIKNAKSKSYPAQRDRIRELTRKNQPAFFLRWFEAGWQLRDANEKTLKVFQNVEELSTWIQSPLLQDS